MRESEQVKSLAPGVLSQSRGIETSCVDAGDEPEVHVRLTMVVTKFVPAIV